MWTVSKCKLIYLFYVTWDLFYIVDVVVNNAGWVFIFISNKVHTIVFITIYFPFHSDHTYCQYFRILRDRSFSRISDEDWGKLFFMFLWNVTIHFVNLIFNAYVQLRKYLLFATVNINEFRLLTMIYIVRSIIFLNIC